MTRRKLFPFIYNNRVTCEFILDCYATKLEIRAVYFFSTEFNTKLFPISFLHT